MAIAHVCLGCGFDLARVRAFREPHYGLPLVVCPRCQAATTRRRHPLWSAFRRFKRLDFTITVLGLQLSLAALLAVFTPFGSLAMVVGVSGTQRNTFDSDLWWLYFWPLAIIGPLTGAWLTMGFSHLNRGRTFLGWYAFLCCITFFGWLLAAVRDDLDSQFMVVQLDPERWPVLARGAVGYVSHAIAMGAVMLSAVAGIPLGWGFQRLTGNLRQTLWRNRRRKRRLRSAA